MTERGGMTGKNFFEKKCNFPIDSASGICYNTHRFKEIIDSRFPRTLRETKGEMVMGTCNFRTMRDFPLIVAEEEKIKVCPDCGLMNDAKADKCECGCDLAEVDAIYDEFGCEERIREMKMVADKLNEEQKFYEVSVESGYYTGIQFYVTEKYGDMEDYTNEDARWEFDCSRSEMLRRFKVAGNKIRRGLEKARKELGMMELNLMAVFSNGEGIYTRVA